MSDSNKYPQTDYRLKNLNNALYVDGNDDVVVRTGFVGNIVISGNVNVPGQVTVNSSPEDPVHVHLTELGTFGNLTTYVPVRGNVTVDNFPAFPSNVSITQMPGITGNVGVSGNVSISQLPGIRGNVNVDNFPSNVRITDMPGITGNVGVSGNVSITQLPALGNVSITAMPGVVVSGNVSVTQMPAISGNVNVNNFPSNVSITSMPSITGNVNVNNFPSNVSITSMPAITGNVTATLTNANVTVVALPSEQNIYNVHCFGNVTNPWTANMTSRPMFAITNTNPAARWFVKSYTFAVPTNVKNNVTPDVMRYIWIKNPTITGNIVYGLQGNNIHVAEFKDAGSVHQNLNANISIDQNSGTILHMDLYFGNNTEVGDELATDWLFTGNDVLVCCQRQLTTNVGSTTDVWWALQVFEE